MQTLIVGDVHGCARELSDLLNKAHFSPSRDRLLLTGDAFARGPDPLGVWHLIEECGADMVLGNHDARLLQQLEALSTNRDPGRVKPDQSFTLHALEPVHSTLLAWLYRVPLYIEEDRFLLVHAGINPERGLAETRFEEFITIRTWPPAKGRIDGPRWHDAYRPVHPLLIFGHDAPGGLVTKRRDGKPYLLGLDTGCVYGRALTGYLLEEERLISTASQQDPEAWKARGR
jgi:hypothetical protein